MYDINGNLIKVDVSSCDDWSNYLWYVVGDSITEKNGRAATHYYDYIANETGINIKVDALSGTGYSMGMGSNANWLQRVPVNIESYNPDVITFFGSGNDMNRAIGTALDTGLSTLGSAINETLDAVLAVKPFTRIGLITPTPWAGYTPNMDNNLSQIADLIVNIGKARGIPVLDLYRCSQLYPDDENFRTEYYKEGNTQDSGIHPNSKGQERIHGHIREFLRSILTQY